MIPSQSRGAGRTPTRRLMATVAVTLGLAVSLSVYLVVRRNETPAPIGTATTSEVNNDEELRSLRSRLARLESMQGRALASKVVEDTVSPEESPPPAPVEPSSPEEKLQKRNEFFAQYFAQLDNIRKAESVDGVFTEKITKSASAELMPGKKFDILSASCGQTLCRIEATTRAGPTSRMDRQNLSMLWITSLGPDLPEASLQHLDDRVVAYFSRQDHQLPQPTTNIQ